MTPRPGPDMPLTEDQANTLYAWLEETDLFDKDGNPVRYWECPLAPLQAALKGWIRHGGGWSYPEVVESRSEPGGLVQLPDGRSLRVREGDTVEDLGRGILQVSATCNSGGVLALPRFPEPAQQYGTATAWVKAPFVRHEGERCVYVPDTTPPTITSAGVGDAKLTAEEST